jgi:DNA polymerase-3 subunit epsilon/exodeoxyribonuclease X
MTSSSVPWQQARLVALDLEGTGAQDREEEAILEIAVVPFADGQPDMANAYCTLVNPGRPVPRRPWISPGLTTRALADAPAIATVEPELARRLNGTYIVGHNVNVDWRLLHRRSPSVQPVALIDTLRLARQAHPGEKGNNLSKLLDRHQLTATVAGLAKDSQPHRALWDTTGTALLLNALVTAQYPHGATIDELLTAAGTGAKTTEEANIQGELFS